ncbi:tetratricopeptide repeat protein [Sphingomonas sp. KR1UV-12]|uniref:Tetratricopeptide repeat protein n=1 Tax=Sphingomonas aurea TaxID=3063994 RepID=A0ABT9EGH3_9SPHN|nr:tetratricopeptide repeat protein [Sphingomonas sp. KR1UV-12]MDP1025942.1 tetratricopeptide repeat protein [Sphingomonas sp. KR1UV-12]
MTMRPILSLGLSMLLFGGLTAGCAMDGQRGLAAAGTRAVKHADYAKGAGKALARQDAPAAVTLAEAAVQAAPDRADYRLLLAQSYLAAGRFASAREAFGDVLRLDGGNAKAALNLALTQLACDDWLGARETLNTHAAIIAPADLGLAQALTGDPARGVATLMDAARQPGATPRVRQNLALSLALAGQWQMARAVAAVDVSPADLDRRMLDWVAFAQPRGAKAQVAALLGVQPAGQDMGQPTALALVQPAPAPAASATQVAVITQEVPQPVARATRIVFGPRQEVVQQLPVATAAVAAPRKLAAPRRPVRVAYLGK